jgi:hypothetical protein
MNLAERVFSVLGVPITWNDILNWLFLIASTLTFIIAIILQIIQSIKNWKKTDK